jgi:hypothetical protein
MRESTARPHDKLPSATFTQALLQHCRAAAGVIAAVWVADALVRT